MKGKNIIVLLVAVAFVALSAIDATAQCAMCRATVESGASENQESIASSLNAGILFLFAMPYLSAAVIIYLWKKKSRQVVSA
ncbi:hypothetical protein FUAX_28820 [Fulvitalea axinellae]|uniref:Uncharacterized protein n=1 Tax=Fulvitalea axinellae TaxID=1182444 RepID=A0AAU9DHA2_9BACT|nr:hypothetical protein FUAX_28820 [Fulvitalea axinellae]